MIPIFFSITFVICSKPTRNFGQYPVLLYHVDVIFLQSVVYLTTFGVICCRFFTFHFSKVGGIHYWQLACTYLNVQWSFISYRRLSQGDLPFKQLWRSSWLSATAPRMLCGLFGRRSAKCQRLLVPAAPWRHKTARHSSSSSSRQQNTAPPHSIYWTLLTPRLTFDAVLKTR